VLRIRLKESDLLSDSQTSRLYGKYANQADYVHGPIDQDCAVYSPRAPGGIAAKLVTVAINTPRRTVELFRTVKGDLSNRGLGVPLMNRKRADGSLSHTKEVPPSLRVSGDSDFLGWYDKAPRFTSCRQTEWSLKHPEILEVSRDFEREVHRVYKQELPQHWKEQMDFMKDVSSAFRYLNSVYSTITLNRDAQFPYHYDTGDFAGGLGNLVVLEGANDESGAMVMPTERLCFLVRPGDILFMNVHSLHGNLPLNGIERLAAVLYARAGMNECGKKGRRR
jgi:hypothetical protein